MYNKEKGQEMEQHIDSQIEDLLYSYFKGDIDEPGKQQLAEWLAADPSHKDIWNRHSEQWAIAASLYFMENEKNDFETNFSHLIKAEKQKHLHVVWRKWRNIAAVVLALISVGISAYYWGMENIVVEPQEILSELPARIITPMGSRSEVVLPDGTHVWMNSGTKLSFIYDKKEMVRNATLDGEAYFEVARDTSRPFVVQTKKLQVKVLGTKFNMKAYSEDHLENVSLLSGRVNVSLEQNMEKEYELFPNNQLNLNVETDDINLQPFSGADVIAWIHGEYRFSNLKFQQIAKDLERKYGVEIIIKSKRLANESFSGVFPADYSLEQIFREIDVEHRYVWFEKNKQWIIREK